MSGTKHLKPGIGVDTKKKKKVKGATDQVGSRGYPVMVMGPTGKTRMEWSNEL